MYIVVHAQIIAIMYVRNCIEVIITLQHNYDEQLLR